MKAFQRQLQRFATSPFDRIAAFDELAIMFGREIQDDIITRQVPSNIVDAKEHGLSMRAVVLKFLPLRTRTKPELRLEDVTCKYHRQLDQ
jgi:hypothetical protein